MSGDAIRCSWRGAYASAVIGVCDGLSGRCVGFVGLTVRLLGELASKRFAIARYLYARGYRWPQRAFARGRHRTKRLGARRRGGDDGRAPHGQGYREGGALAHRHALQAVAPWGLLGIPLGGLLLSDEAGVQEVRQEAARRPDQTVLELRPVGREAKPPPRRPGLLQGGRVEQAHNPRGHILGQGESRSRLRLLRQGGGEQDEVYARLLWREEDTMEIEATR